MTSADSILTEDDRRFGLWLLRRESFRRITFDDDWPHENIPGLSRDDCAKAGLFYTGVEDRLQCAFCLIVIFNWEGPDTALGEHRRFTMIERAGETPACFCPFIMGDPVGNIPLEPATTRERSSNIPIPQPFNAANPFAVPAPLQQSMMSARRTLTEDVPPHLINSSQEERLLSALRTPSPGIIITLSYIL